MPSIHELKTQELMAKKFIRFRVLKTSRNNFDEKIKITRSDIFLIIKRPHRFLKPVRSRFILIIFNQLIVCQLRTEKLPTEKSTFYLRRK
jgi:hypothetical protein